MLNKVNIKDVKDAIEYLWTEGFVDEMTRDKRYYVSVLLAKVANDYQIKLTSSESPLSASRSIISKISSASLSP